MDAPVLRQEVPETYDLYEVEPDSPELPNPQQIIRPIFKRAPNELYCESEARDLPMNQRVIALRDHHVELERPKHFVDISRVFQ